MVNFEEALKKPFTDMGKLIIGIILSIIPIVNWIAQGFMMECSGVGKVAPSKKMPEWKNMWYYFVKGLASYAIAFIYMIPALAVFSLAIGYAVGSLAAALVGGLPEGVISSLSSGQVPNEEIATLFSQNWATVLPVLMSVGPLALIGLILLLVALYISPIAVLNYLKSNKFGKAFELSAVASKAFTGKYFIVWLVTGVIALILKGVLSFIPWVGVAIATFVSGVIGWSLYGQVMREKK